MGVSQGLGPRVSPLVAAAAAAAALAGAAGARGVDATVHERIALLPLQHGQINRITVDASSNGAVGVSLGNDATLGATRAVAAVEAPRGAGRSTFRVYVVSAREPTTALEPAALDLVVRSPRAAALAVVHADDVTRACAVLRQLNGWFESRRSHAVSGGSTFTLLALRPASEQPADAEEILDDVVASSWLAAGCRGTPEPPDAGSP